MSGPLAGVRVLEIASIGPAPFAGMMLSDLGAEVLRIDRPVASAPAVPGPRRLLSRGRRSVALDLKRTEAVALLLELVEHSDVLIEGFRPGVAERLGIGPNVCLERNPRLVYGRMTGWGQDGPLAPAAGHDINYIALTGALAAIGPHEAPIAPLNLVGDFGGGGMLLAVGVLAALVERGASGAGQVVDAAMVDGAALLMTMFYEMRNADTWTVSRESNLLDGGAPFYGVYETADARFVAIGALEPQFFQELLTVLDIDASASAQHDRSAWPRLRNQIASAIRTRTRDDWENMFAGRDACVAPVLTIDEAPMHPHNRARGAFIAGEFGWEPAPSPRFGRTPADGLPSQVDDGEGLTQLLSAWDIPDDLVERLLAVQAIT
jgi:alpha-methylacyl-CoA racemase